ncbi:nucleophile aminohydrolase [Dipodascopsis uninucleata]
MTFIALHVGAGFHSSLKEGQYKELCKRACKVGLDQLNQESDATTAVSEVCKVLEDSHLTNAGVGSNLNSDGLVECDASIMESRSGRGAGIGCISNAHNPIDVARRLLLQSFEQRPFGLVCPAILTGSGSCKFARENGAKIATQDELLSPESKERYDKWSELLTMRAGTNIEFDIECGNAVTDTVGVICIDSKNNVAVATSSGGVAMKYPGRVGPAAILGSGLWVTTTNKTDLSANGSVVNTIAVCASGTGEDIVYLNLASQCANIIADCDENNDEITAIYDWLRKISQHHNLQANPPALGLLSVINTGDFYHMIFAHTTQSMCIAYMNSDQKEATFQISRLHNSNIVVGGASKPARNIGVK